MQLCSQHFGIWYSAYRIYFTKYRCHCRYTYTHTDIPGPLYPSLPHRPRRTLSFVSRIATTSKQVNFWSVKLNNNEKVSRDLYSRTKCNKTKTTQNKAEKSETHLNTHTRIQARSRVRERERMERTIRCCVDIVCFRIISVQHNNSHCEIFQWNNNNVLYE